MRKRSEMPRRSRAVWPASLPIGSRQTIERGEERTTTTTTKKEKKTPHEGETRRNGMTIVEEEAERIKDGIAARGQGRLKEGNQAKRWATTGCLPPEENS